MGVSDRFTVFEVGQGAFAGHTGVPAITIEGTKTNPTDAFGIASDAPDVRRPTAP